MKKNPFRSVAIRVACGAAYFSVPMACLIPWAAISAVGVSKDVDRPSITNEENDRADEQGRSAGLLALLPRCILISGPAVAPAFAAAIPDHAAHYQRHRFKHFPRPASSDEYQTGTLDGSVVIPEIRLLLLPIRPRYSCSRSERMPKITTSIPISSLFQIESPGSCGSSAINRIRAIPPAKITNRKEISFSVLGTVPPSPFSFQGQTVAEEEMIVGIVFNQSDESAAYCAEKHQSASRTPGKWRRNDLNKDFGGRVPGVTAHR